MNWYTTVLVMAAMRMAALVMAVLAKRRYWSRRSFYA
jgi:hypothetical protein